MSGSDGTDVMVTKARGLILIMATTAVIGPAIGRLSPVAVVQKYQNVLQILNVCRSTVVDVQPFVLVVFAFTDAPDGFLKRLHHTVGAAILLSNRTDNPGMDSQVALIMADEPGTLTDMIDHGQVVWDPMSHYIWLMPATNHVKAISLFRAVWRQRKVINVVITASTVAYTYNPFRDTLREQAIDVDGLRKVARLKMVDLNGHPVRICMFPTRLNAVKQPDGSYKGMDGVVVSTLAKHMNFTPIYNVPTDGRKYGWAESDFQTDTNFTYKGLLGDLVYNHADMAFNGAFLNVIYSHFLYFIS